MNKYKWMFRIETLKHIALFLFISFIIGLIDGNFDLFIFYIIFSLIIFIIVSLFEIYYNKFIERGDD